MKLCLSLSTSMGQRYWQWCDGGFGGKFALIFCTYTHTHTFRGLTATLQNEMVMSVKAIANGKSGQASNVRSRECSRSWVSVNVMEKYCCVLEIVNLASRLALLSQPHTHQATQATQAQCYFSFIPLTTNSWDKSLPAKHQWQLSLLICVQGFIAMTVKSVGQFCVKRHMWAHMLHGGRRKEFIPWWTDIWLLKFF